MEDFQAFTVRYSGRTNVLISKVGVSQAFDPEATTNRPQITELKSIWDTGASCTLISKQYATQIGLIPSGKTTITGVNHTTEENTYLVNVYLPNKVCLTYVQIAEAPALSDDAGMLIGMDIIGSGDFSVFTEDGKTVMSYRFPSVGGADFVREAGNIRSRREILQPIEEQAKYRKPISEKEREKRKQAIKNKRKQRKQQKHKH